ncbi:MAG TPA: NAD(P)/FAD-dependent oxidoreductase [Bacilli bacterium]|nr:NAD(P)/FAD-dependent oxidoreductase [Bacilli bacterium]
MKKEYEVIIIGSGPAGISAALYLKQAGKDIALFDGKMPGGNLNKVSSILNYPGYIGIDGSTLAYNMFEQINSNDIPFILETVQEVSGSDNNFSIKTNNDLYNAKYIIIATGRNFEGNSYKDIEKYIGNGVSYCVFCDGNLYKNKDVMLISDKDYEESLKYLSKICNKVILVTKEEINNYDNVEIINNFIFQDIDKIEKKFIIKHNDIETSVDGIFISYASISPSKFINNIDIEYINNYIVVNDNMETRTKNIYAVGDAIKKDMYQIVTAVSDGAIAAKEIINNINNKI